MSATRDWMWRTNSCSTASRSPRMGSKICARSAETGMFCAVSVNGNSRDGRPTIPDSGAGCQRAKPLLQRELDCINGPIAVNDGMEVRRRLRGYLFHAGAAYCGKSFHDFRHEGRLVALAAKWHRRQVW